MNNLELLYHIANSRIRLSAVEAENLCDAIDIKQQGALQGSWLTKGPVLPTGAESTMKVVMASLTPRRLTKRDKAL